MHAALKNTVRWLAPILAGATFVAANLATPATAQTTFKMAYALSQQSHYGAAGEAFAKTLEDGSGGRLKVQQFPNSALGGEREVIEGLQLGTIDLAVLSTGATMNFVPAAGVFDVPFLLRDLDHARHVLDSDIGQDMLKEFSKRGLVALAWGEQGFRHLTNNVRPVVTPADAKGLKIRTTENQLHIAAFRQIGILPTPMAWPEVTTALQQGTIDGQENPLSVITSAKLCTCESLAEVIIDGQENPLSVITSAKLSQVQKYLSLTGHVYAPAVIIASPSAYESLSAEDKALLQQAGKNAGQAMRDFVSNVEQAGIEQLKAEGMEINTVDREAFAKAVEPVYKEYNRRFDPKLIERIRNTQ